MTDMTPSPPTAGELPSIQHFQGTSYLWESQDLRMAADDFGTLQVVPFCFGPWMQDSFEAY